MRSTSPSSTLLLTLICCRYESQIAALEAALKMRSLDEGFGQCNSTSRQLPKASDLPPNSILLDLRSERAALELRDASDTATKQSYAERDRIDETHAEVKRLQAQVAKSILAADAAMAQNAAERVANDAVRATLSHLAEELSQSTTSNLPKGKVSSARVKEVLHRSVFFTQARHSSS